MRSYYYPHAHRAALPLQLQVPYLQLWIFNLSLLISSLADQDLTLACLGCKACCDIHIVARAVMYSSISTQSWVPAVSAWVGDT
jgi:hypothetical protein